MGSRPSSRALILFLDIVSKIFKANVQELAKAWMAAQYALTRRGPLTMAPCQLGLFAGSAPGVQRADLGWNVLALSRSGPAGAAGAVVDARLQVQGLSRWPASTPTTGSTPPAVPG